VEVLRVRLGRQVSIEGLPCGETREMGGVRVSFHPAGHVLGSAQVRVEHRGEVWVVSGDYKTEPDPTCAPFEPVRCDTFITESTFGLPVYRWPAASGVFREIDAWWSENRREGRLSVLHGYSLGKAQRLLAGVESGAGPILVHPAVAEMLPAYAAAGVRLPEVSVVRRGDLKKADRQALVVAPPGGQGGAESDDWGEASVAFASGWMLVRGMRRRGGAERGFVLSDHADWPGLIQAIRATGAGRVLVTHGSSRALVRWLNENGWRAEPLATRFLGEAGSEGAPEPESGAGA
jgi:putative mRNA 3-end processing factor